MAHLKFFLFPLLAVMLTSAPKGWAQGGLTSGERDAIQLSVSGFYEAQSETKERLEALAKFEVGERPLAEVCFRAACFQVEVALSGEEHRAGLMNRKSLDPMGGMLFAYQEEQLLQMWMKNMTFSLDIVWINAVSKIVRMDTDVPPCRKGPCEGVASEVPVMYVLELASGAAAQAKLKVGDTMTMDLVTLPEEEATTL